MSWGRRGRIESVLAALLLLIPGRAPLPAADPGPGHRAALELVYQGHLDRALVRLRAAADAGPGDAMAAYVLALALCWKVEQQPESEAHDHELTSAAALAISRADARLAQDAGDVGALFARGAAHGALSRYHLFRLHRADAARAAVRMREDLTRVRALDPRHEDALFGLGLYDYYADVLPRAAKVIRFLARIPGGNRARGLASIEKAAERRTLHHIEARVQLFEIHAFYEDRPSRAMDQLDALRRQYPTHPLWALRSAEHLRARLGAYRDAVSAGREILARAKRGEANYEGPWVPALARLEMGHALLGDLRPAEARPFLLAVATEGIPGYAAAATRARYLIGRALETEGDRVGALAHYRVAAGGPDSEWRRAARAAVSTPMPAARVRALAALAQGRREREANRDQAAIPFAREALREWPESVEAALTLADDRLRRGDLAGARAVWPRPDARQMADTPWLRGWEWLLEGERHDLEGRREEAVRQYKKVLEESFRRPELLARAEAGIKASPHPVTAPATRGGVHAISTSLSTA